MTAVWIGLGFGLGCMVAAVVGKFLSKRRLPEMMEFGGHRYLAVPQGYFMMPLGYAQPRREVAR